MSDPIESRLLRLHAEGTQGEWRDDGQLSILDVEGYAFIDAMDDEDRALIVASHNALPALCAVVAAARKVAMEAETTAAFDLEAALAALDSRKGE